MMHSFLSCVFAGLFAVSALAGPVKPRQLVLQKPKTPVDFDVYQNIVKYTRYPTVANLLAEGPCSNPPYGSVIENYYDNKETDTQAAIFRNDADKQIVVGIPGTNSTQDYITDFTFVPVPYISPNVVCIGCFTHIGFLGAWNSIAEDVEGGVRDLIQKYPDYEVIVTGTSLGGALASLAFATLKAGKLPVTAAYTYGQPRVGNVLYADYIDQLAGANDTEAGIYHRVTHYNDGVPQLPPIILGGFWHSRTEYWESADTPSFNTTYRCFGQEPADCNDQAGGVGINAAHGGYANLHYTCNP